MCVTSIVVRQRFRIDRKAVILRSDRDFARREILDRLVPAAMPEL